MRHVLWPCGTTEGGPVVNLDSSSFFSSAGGVFVASSGHFVGPRPWFNIEEEVEDAMASLVGATKGEVLQVVVAMSFSLFLALEAFRAVQGVLRMPLPPCRLL